MKGKVRRKGGDHTLRILPPENPIEPEQPRETSMESHKTMTSPSPELSPEQAKETNPSDPSISHTDTNTHGSIEIDEAIPAHSEEKSPLTQQPAGQVPKIVKTNKERKKMLGQGKPKRITQQPDRYGHNICEQLCVGQTDTCLNGRV